MKKNREGHKWDSETDSKTWTVREEDTQKHLRDREMDLLVVSSFLNCPLHHGERRPFWGCDVADGHHCSCPTPTLPLSFPATTRRMHGWIQLRLDSRGDRACAGARRLTDISLCVCVRLCIHTQNHLTDLTNPLVLNSCFSRTKLKKMVSFGPNRNTACPIELMLQSDINMSPRLRYRADSGKSAWMTCDSPKSHKSL